MESGIHRPIKKNALLFLTGAVNPNGMVFTKLQDAGERKKQYIEAIEYYYNNYPNPILFVENTNTDISSDLTISNFSDRLEMITFDGNSYDQSLGKGFGEYLIIKEAVKRSVFFSNADFVFKITGRHKVLNLKLLINQYEADKHIDVFVDIWDNGRYADSRCWGATPAFIKDIFLEYAQSINDSKEIIFEYMLAKSVIKAILLDKKFELFKHLPRFMGSSGTLNQKFNHSFLYWFPRDILRQLRYWLNSK